MNRPYKIQQKSWTHHKRFFVRDVSDYFYCKAIIKKHSKDFGGTLDDPDVLKLCGCSRISYYKYKREIKRES